MKFFAIAFFALLLCGCSTMQNLFADTVVGEKLNLAKEAPARYSENPQMNVPANRQYRRMTRSRMEDESELNSNAGSMWVGDGQSSYLFTQNKTRKEGDILNVKLEGAALRQVETKVSVIKKLLKQLEEQQAAEAQQKLADSTDAAGPARKPAAEAPKEEKKPEKEEKEDLTDVQNVSSRIVERMPDGNYRVKGAQPFMIGKREYKVIVTGMIRPEDYNDEGVASAKLLDPQYDVVSVRRKQNNEEHSTL